MTCFATSVGNVDGSPRPAFGPRNFTMPLSFAVNVPTIFVDDETANVSDWPLSEAPCRFELLTVIVTKPLLVPLAAVYAVSVPLSTYITFGAAWLCAPGLAGLRFARARLGTSNAAA